MKLGFYPRLAWSGIRKNKRLFVPYILAAAGTAAVFYIMFYLASGDLLDGMRGGMTAQSTLSLGVFVIVAFALLFLFYCNSFLVRRRYKEFGLYSILGMNRKNISRVLAWETLLTALLSLIGGIFIGALLSKLAEMIFLHMLGGTADYSLHISLPAIKYMLLYFGGIFALIYISSLIKLHRSTAVELVHSESYGEKPVKANPVLGIAGVILLSAAYILAVSIKEPLQALTIFFIAVIMVIVGTYLVFISGSVLLCKILQKNKRYYYTPRHFVSVSSMTYGIKATDEAGNSSEKTGKIIVCDAIAELEASMDMVTESDVLAALGGDYAGYKMESEPFERTSLGAHAMVFAKGDEKINVGVVIKDTVAPTAEGIDCQCSTGYYCEPIKFVTNVADMSKVTAKFVNEPDWSVEGEQNVQIVLTDRAGNETTVEAKAIIAPDTTAPVIYAARDRYCYVGEAVSYFKEVFAEDNADPEPEIEVDKSKVDAKTAGTYDVTYTATDHEGNTSSVTVKYTFVEKKIDDAKLDEAVDKVLKEIITDDMSVPEQAYAIFDYCYSNIIYTGTSDKTDWKSEAYRGLTEGVGDCFTFYSASYALLQKIDCQVLSVERLNGKTQHFWCLVNLGTGWYHFDACNVGPEHLRCFMKTSEELVKYSVQYWRFDTSLYPPLETTPYSMS